jgi:CubicO group peptidase (beta-lactamase class C family)
MRTWLSSFPAGRLLALLVAALLGTHPPAASAAGPFQATPQQAAPDTTDADTTDADTLAAQGLQARLAAFRDAHPSVVGVAGGLVDGTDTETAAVGNASTDGEPVRDSTLFQIGSITKTFTGLLLARRVAEEDLAPGDPVATLLPDSLDVPSRDGTAITLGHLASHASGLPRLPRNIQFLVRDPANPYAHYDVPDLYAALDGAGLQSEPGSTYDYSNYGAGLLGAVLAERADTSYEEAVVSRIATPLGLDDTRMTLTDAQKQRAATFYRSDGSETKPWTFTDAMAGAGAFYSTVQDMLAFLRAQMHPEKTQELTGAIQTSHDVLFDADNGPTVAYGWHVMQYEGRTVYWHNGGTYGAQSFTAFAPQHDVGVVMLANTGINGETRRAFEKMALEALTARIETEE